MISCVPSPDAARDAKILVIRFSSIGDIVLTTPVLRCLKQQLGAEVHVLTKESFRTILEANPYVDRVISIRHKVGEAAAQLRETRYTAVVDLHCNLRSFQVRLLLWRTPSFGFDKQNIAKWGLVRLKSRSVQIPHVVDRYLAAAARLGIVPDGQGLDFFIPPDQELELARLATEMQAGDALREAIEGGQYLALVVGAAHATKRLPLEKAIALCRKLPKPIVLLGGAPEREEGERIAAECPGVFNACGRYSLQQSASILRQSSKVIANDTGLMHIAAAFHKEIISLWGSTVPEFGMSPYYPKGMSRNASVEVQGLSCRPCSKIGFQQCPQGHFSCMRQLDEERIARLAGKKSVAEGG